MVQSLNYYEQGTISEIKVCQNGRGMYYIGRTFTHEDGFEEPYDRISQEYFRTRDEAELALQYREFTPRYYDLDEKTRKMVFKFMQSK